MSIHDGHRQRLRERFAKYGMESFNEHEVLELLLYYVIPRSDTNGIAHNLVNKFGSFRQVLEASYDQLLQVDGVGPNTALYLSALRESYRYLAISKVRERPILRNAEEYAAFVKDFYFSTKVETVYLLCLDAMNAVIECAKISEGEAVSVEIPSRTLADVALRTNAVSAVLVHNHPRGLALPSEEDVIATDVVAQVLNMTNVRLLDHIIISEGGMISLANSANNIACFADRRGRK